MRTKSLLLAAALTAAGLASSLAQSNVYSLNVVGYVNATNFGGYKLLVNPLTVGASNGANEVYGAALSDGTTILKWNGAGFTGYFYDTSIGGNPGNWYQLDQATSNNVPTLAPGVGYFFSPGAVGTNLFLGAVGVNTGATNSRAIPGGYSMLGSVLPIAAAVTNSVFNLPLSDGTTVLKWNGAGYTGFFFDTSIGGSANNWYQLDQATPSAVPSMAVGEGFFISPGALSTWTQVIP